MNEQQTVQDNEIDRSLGATSASYVRCEVGPNHNDDLQCAGFGLTDVWTLSGWEQDAMAQGLIQMFFILACLRPWPCTIYEVAALDLQLDKTKREL
jgi:hypothetical protein